MPFSDDKDPIAEALPAEALPVVWLLGKTGAGKSSLVRALTQQSDAEIGNGFQACTPSARAYDFPPDLPLLRFLDTRGLGEANYDPTADLAECRNRSHVVLVVCRLDDPVQGAVADAFEEIARHDAKLRAILVLTGADLLRDVGARERAQITVFKTMSRAARRKDLPVVTVSLSPEAEEGVEQLRAELLKVLPAVGLLLAQDRASGDEGAAFQAIRNRVLFYAGLAASTDLVPIVGAVTVPTVQLGMLRELGQHYDVHWDRRTMSAFLGALGVGLGARFAASYGLRQLAKLIPVYGQTVGAAASGSISFATTYALGRTAAYFLHTHASGSDTDEADLRAVYAKAFSRSSDAPD